MSLLWRSWLRRTFKSGPHFLPERNPVRPTLEVQELRWLFDVTNVQGTTLTPVAEGKLAAPAATFQVDTADRHLSAAISWGDGTTSPETINHLPGIDRVADHASGMALRTATVTEADAPTVTATTLSATAGKFFSDTIDMYTDTCTGNSASDFTATISWGDGAATATATSTASVGTGSDTVTGTSFSTTEGSTFTGSVAPFTESYSGADASDFTATINWGDGTTSTGTEGDDLTAIGTTFTGTVATLTDMFTDNSASDFTVTIDWGEGATSLGAISGSGGSFTMTGSHTCTTDRGAVPVLVRISADCPGTATDIAVSAADVTMKGPLVAFTTVTTTEDIPIAATVACCADSTTALTASDFTVTIDWGDGATSPGTVVEANAIVQVTGTHTCTDDEGDL